jgi:signal transduction histidine kinase
MVAFLAAALVLLLRWRLVGVAASALLSAAMLLAGLLLAPVTQLGGRAPSYAVALNTTSVVFMLGACLGALTLPVVWAGLRPTLLMVTAIGGAVALAVPLALTPLAAHMQSSSHGIGVVSTVEGFACAMVAFALLVKGIRSGRALIAGSGVVLVAVAVARAAPLWATGAWTALPTFLLLVSAAEFLLLGRADLRLTLKNVVLHDVRGRRRWVAAEAELDRVRRVYRGRSHDVTSMLAAMDGTLHVLSLERASLRPEDTNRLIVAVRDQIEQLRTVLAGDGATRLYDLSGMLMGVVALRATGAQPVLAAIDPGLTAHGHPDRVMLIVNNLLANAEVHAPRASVTVLARRDPTADECVEITVCDDGPGLADTELGRAFEPGWRGGAAAVAGSGLGLTQCRELAQAEGGEIVLEPTELAGQPGRGLTARLRIPVK